MQNTICVRWQMRRAHVAHPASIVRRRLPVNDGKQMALGAETGRGRRTSRVLFPRWQSGIHVVMTCSYCRHLAVFHARLIAAAGGGLRCSGRNDVSTCGCVGTTGCVQRLGGGPFVRPRTVTLRRFKNRRTPLLGGYGTGKWSINEHCAAWLLGSWFLSIQN